MSAGGAPGVPHRSAALPALACLLAAAPGITPAAAGDATPQPDVILRDTLKGDARLSVAPQWPQGYLGLMPAQAPNAASAAVAPGSSGASGQPLCGATLASAPVILGPRDRFAKVAGAAQSVGLALLGQLVSSGAGHKLQGMPARGGSEAKTPALFKDPIKSKYRGEVKDAASGIKLDLGAELAPDGLLLSTRLDSTRGKGTLQEIYLERDDCRRIYPFAEYAYELWGSWSLSVSWTRTESTYQDGKLINQQTTSGGFNRQGSGLLASGAGSLPLSASLGRLPPELASAIGRYQAQVQAETGSPMWQRLGFAAPTSGARSVGAAFRLSAADLEAIGEKRMLAIVQVTREEGPNFEAIGVPVALGPAKDAHLSFASAAPPRR